MATNETILTLGNLVIPVGAGRGITQSLQPIDNGSLRRTVNGNLVDLTREENRKFESQIRCTDMATPAMAELWKGTEILVGCISILNQNVNPIANAVTLIRDPVAGSIFGFEVDGTKHEPVSVLGRDITFDVGIDVANVEFRPELNMRVVANSTSTDEYEAEEGWQIDLQEI